jgi:hypothetical protein
MHKILSKRPTNALGFIDASLLQYDHRIVSATHGQLQDGENKNTNIVIMCWVTPKFEKYIVFG